MNCHFRPFRLPIGSLSAGLQSKSLPSTELLLQNSFAISVEFTIWMANRSQSMWLKFCIEMFTCPFMLALFVIHYGVCHRSNNVHMSLHFIISGRLKNGVFWADEWKKECKKEWKKWKKEWKEERKKKNGKQKKKNEKQRKEWKTEWTPAMHIEIVQMKLCKWTICKTVTLKPMQMNADTS